MRFLRTGWPIVPAVAAIALSAQPSETDPIVRSILLAVAAVGLTAAVTMGYLRSRVEPLVRAAERIAAGEAGVEVPARRDDLGRRLALADPAPRFQHGRSDTRTPRPTS